MDLLRKEVKFTPLNAVRIIPSILTRLTRKDRIGGILVRWAVGRNDYRVEPGLYSCNSPDKDSPVLVTANYKLTFDSVRKELGNLSVWILALDTKGVNVWCAAGKGTFGTEELLRQIKITGLSNIVSHRELILPQLGAPGVAAHTITSQSGFKVRYGPVYARDIPAYLSNGKVKTDAMKRIGFTLRERLAVAPVEIAHSWPFLLGSLLLSSLFALPLDTTSAHRFLFSTLTVSGGIIVGTVLFPALLPILPFRAFTLKGAFLGILWTLSMVYVSNRFASVVQPFGIAVISSLPLMLLTVPMVSFLSMNFTGASTYTCQKGVEVEVTVGLPLMLISALAGIIIGVLHFLGAH